MMLTEVKQGDSAKIVSIHGGCHHRRRLSFRGISEGCIVRIISNIGPVTVEVDRNVVSIGRGMARKIRVRRL